MPTNSLSPRGRATNPYFLIEYREGGQTRGYLQDADSGWSSAITPDSFQARRFRTRAEAWALIEGDEFQKYMPHPERFAVEGHLDCNGPAPEDETSGLSPRGDDGTAKAQEQKHEG